MSTRPRIEFNKDGVCNACVWMEEKKNLDLAVTSRDQTHQIEYNNFKMTSFFFKDDKFDESLKLKLEEANYILISIPPIDGKDIVVKYLDTNFKNLRNCRWITYLSATSVMETTKAIGLMKKVLLNQPHQAV